MGARKAFSHMRWLWIESSADQWLRVGWLARAHEVDLWFMWDLANVCRGWLAWRS